MSHQIWVTAKKFAELAGVTKSAVSQSSRADRILGPAVDDRTRKIDLNHPAVAAYEAKLNIKINRSEFNKSPFQSSDAPQGDRPVADYDKMTLPEIIDKFGSDEGFKTWLQARKLIVEIQAKEIANAEKMGTLISKQLVENHIISPFNGAHLRILTDGVKAIAADCHALANAGEPVTSLEIAIEDILSKNLKGVKDKVAKALK